MKLTYEYHPRAGVIGQPHVFICIAGKSLECFLMRYPTQGWFFCCDDGIALSADTYFQIAEKLKELNANDQ